MRKLVQCKTVYISTLTLIFWERIFEEDFCKSAKKTLIPSDMSETRIRNFQKSVNTVNKMELLTERNSMKLSNTV